MGEGHLLADRYRLDEVVGRGGMGTVWRAYDVTLDREVAIKEVVLPPGLTAKERDVLYERTFREARASARLNHPGVVTVHDVVQESGRPWIVMELVRARSLQDLIEQGPLDPRRVAEIGLQTLSALRAAHEKGILHRDVKPSNVLITDSGRVVLTDFGIAQAEGDSALTQTGLVMGSPAYIPPERARGERAVPASDLWSLGATLYAAVEGRSPYERSDAMASLAAALSEPVPPSRNAGPLAPVLDGLLAREPAHRMTAAQAMPLLTRIASAPPPPPPPPSRAMRVPPPRPPAERHPPSRRPAEAPRASSGLRRADETVVDDPGSGFGAAASTSVPAPARTGDDRRGADETVLDATEFYGEPRDGRGAAPSPSPAPPVSSPSPSPSPSAPSYRSGGASRPSGGADSEARTLLETEWEPAARRPSSRSAAPPPWERSAEPLRRWEPSSAARRGDVSEQVRTLVYVVVAVILVVAAVLAGAFILRSKLTGG
ncbi:serine/threonine-protein kinase [Actinomadura sp. NBRC 104425]|uniref:serine/threonine-protein kinase n=1 Tax=Actinomadura sp. NBRC 104425 TaxID=3032204 RepID=UPI002556B845|nr:serine/threonine-protein kinase [Actinomadura sp. NBRC 104425]